MFSTFIQRNISSIFNKTFCQVSDINQGKNILLICTKWIKSKNELFLRILAQILSAISNFGIFFAMQIESTQQFTKAKIEYQA